MAVLAVMALFMTVFFSSVVVDLQAQANSFDLTKLEQMESASVILDRNGKIFGQIYVENRDGDIKPWPEIPRPPKAIARRRFEVCFGRFQAGKRLANEGRRQTPNAQRSVSKRERKLNIASWTLIVVRWTFSN